MMKEKNWFHKYLLLSDATCIATAWFLVLFFFFSDGYTTIATGGAEQVQLC
jgi:hypothetical protein